METTLINNQSESVVQNVHGRLADDGEIQIKVPDSFIDYYKNKVKYFLDYAPHLGIREVPDPYYGEKFGFERVLDMVEDASLGFLETLQQAGTLS